MSALAPNVKKNLLKKWHPNTGGGKKSGIIYTAAAWHI